MTLAREILGKCVGNLGTYGWNLLGKGVLNKLKAFVKIISLSCYNIYPMESWYYHGTTALSTGINLELDINRSYRRST